MLATYREILNQYWGYSQFRDLQEDIIQSIGSGKDTLGLMPTGGGKSITFQVPALAKPGLCIVVTPLIALMKDQVQNLRKRGIKAIAVFSGMTREEILVALENCIFGDYKFLYISPERLDTEIFRTKLRKMKINMIAVDESHCISQWGYDFRPAYLKIAEIRELLPGVPVLALTATATPQVVKDIQTKLHFGKDNVFRMSFERQNLAYIVRKTENKPGQLLNILKKMPGCAIVYTRSRKRTKEIAELLIKENITAEFYHAGLNNELKDIRQAKWQKGESRVMVATNAFGMGIDKPDVRLVIHMDLPDSPEAYFQEAGRAGRDGHKAYAIILYSSRDKTTLHKRIPDTFPDKEYIRKVYEHLNYFYQMAMGDGIGCVYDFNLEEFCYKFKHFPVQAHNALKIITQAGYIEYTDEQDNLSRLKFILRKDELYKLSELSKETDLLIQTILRSYTGLFTDYAYIQESSLSIRTGLTTQQIYECLLTLSKRHILHYIPRKKTPFIIYTRERVDLKYLHISKEVYEDRKERYKERIEAMISYVEGENCRSRMLLRYFGEKNENNCSQCDICQHKTNNEPDQYAVDQLKEKIKQSGPVSVSSPTLGDNAEKEDKALEYLLHEEEISFKDGIITTNK